MSARPHLLHFIERKAGAYSRADNAYIRLRFATSSILHANLLYKQAKDNSVDQHSTARASARYPNAECPAQRTS